MLNRAAWSRSSLLAAGVALSVISSVSGAVTEQGVVRQPRNIYELIHSFEHTFVKVLRGEELKQYGTMSPEEMRAANPKLYERISNDVKGWTDEWIESVKTSGDQIPSRRLSEAVQVAEHIDAVLRGYFESKEWPYRAMHVIFLPPRVFLDERNRGDITSGMFIPYYPDAFFATVDWPTPMELILVHESLHFNAAGKPFGLSLAEGLTQTATIYLLHKYDLLSSGKINRAAAYPVECKGVEFVLGKITERTGRNHDEALEMLLKAYLSGRQEEMAEVFGKEPWEQVLELSGSYGDWQTHRIAKVLGK